MLRRRHWRSAALLIALACLIQWRVHEVAVLPALDCVRYVAAAQQMERDGFAAVIARDADQPLFPLAVAVAHRCLPATIAKQPTAWLFAARFVATIAVVLTVVATYALLALWLGRHKALIGALLVAALPQVARLGADGLSDSLHLLLCALALALACWSLVATDRRVARVALVLAGAALGAGLLVRAEAAILIAAATATLFAFAWHNSRSLATALASPAPLLLGAAVVFVPYLAATESFTPSTLLARVLGSHRADAAAILNASAAGALTMTTLAATDEGLEFGRKDFSISQRQRGAIAATTSYFAELAALAHYFVGLVAIWGAWKMRRESIVTPGGFLFLCFVGYSCAAIAHAALSGYLSARHLLPLVPIIAGWASHGVVLTGEAITARMRRLAAQTSRLSTPIRCLPVTGLLTAVVLVALAPATFAPLHASRAAHREAAEWLAANSHASQAVLDSRGLSALYTGRLTFRHEAAPAALANRDLGFVVVEREETTTGSRRASTLRMLLDASAELSASFQSPGADAGKAVLVYRWMPERFAARFQSPVSIETN